eukprot:scaffold27.g5970.t1
MEDAEGSHEEALVLEQVTSVVSFLHDKGFWAAEQALLREVEGRYPLREPVQRQASASPAGGAAGGAAPTGAAASPPGAQRVQQAAPSKDGGQEGAGIDLQAGLLSGSLRPANSMDSAEKVLEAWRSKSTTPAASPKKLGGGSTPLSPLSPAKSASPTAGGGWSSDADEWEDDDDPGYWRVDVPGQESGYRGAELDRLSERSRTSASGYDHDRLSHHSRHGSLDLLLQGSGEVAAAFAHHSPHGSMDMLQHLPEGLPCVGSAASSRGGGWRQQQQQQQQRPPSGHTAAQRLQHQPADQDLLPLSEPVQLYEPVSPATHQHQHGDLAPLGQADPKGSPLAVVGRSSGSYTSADVLPLSPTHHHEDAPQQAQQQEHAPQQAQQERAPQQARSARRRAGDSPQEDVLDLVCRRSDSFTQRQAGTAEWVLDRANNLGSGDPYRSLMQHLDRPPTSHSQHSQHSSGGGGVARGAAADAACGGASASASADTIAEEVSAGSVCEMGVAPAARALQRPPLPPHQQRPSESPQNSDGSRGGPLPKQGSIMQVSSLSEALLQQVVEELGISDDACTGEEEQQQPGTGQPDDAAGAEQADGAALHQRQQPQQQGGDRQRWQELGAEAVPGLEDEATGDAALASARAASPTDSLREPSSSSAAAAAAEQGDGGGGAAQPGRLGLQGPGRGPGRGGGAGDEKFSFPTASPPGAPPPLPPEPSPLFASWPSFKNLSSPERTGAGSDFYEEEEEDGGEEGSPCVHGVRRSQSQPAAGGGGAQLPRRRRGAAAAARRRGALGQQARLAAAATAGAAIKFPPLAVPAPLPAAEGEWGASAEFGGDVDGLHLGGAGAYYPPHACTPSSSTPVGGISAPSDALAAYEFDQDEFDRRAWHRGSEAAVAFQPHGSALGTRYDVLTLKVVHCRHSTGFEQSKEVPLHINDLIAGRYQIVDMLGQAAFSRAVQALDIKTGSLVCLKIIKNNKDYFDQSLDEIKLLRYVNCADPADEHGILRLYDFFYYKEHLVLVCELLRANLYEFQKYNRESGDPPYFTLPRIQSIARQVLTSLAFLHSLGLVHADLKPENILIKSYSRCEVKVIDLGSSCYLTDHLSSYVQSRSYRAPEVILGLPYDQKIDVWSLGCILAELCTAKVLLQNDSLPALLARLEGVLGPLPRWMLVQGRFSHKYFTRAGRVFERHPTTGRLEFLQPKRTSLARRVPQADAGLLSFLKHLLQPDPTRRPSAEQALQHPWLQQCYLGLNKYSSKITQPKSQGASQAMLYATGLTPDDMDKPQARASDAVGISSVWWEGNPCNMHLNDLAAEVRAGVVDTGMVGMRFNTIGVSDGISMGTDGMSFSLQSRDLIADSIETVMSAQWYDANISLPGCDKNMPGTLIAMARLNRPSLMIYGGTIKPGRSRLGGDTLDVVSAFQSFGGYAAGLIDEEQRCDVVRNSCPGPGACGGMYTANTMASAIEALGMSLPYSSSTPAVDPMKVVECRLAGRYVLELLKRDIKPRDIMTRAAFENAMVLVMALGGSTNAGARACGGRGLRAGRGEERRAGRVLHLIAMAKACGLWLTLDDFQAVSNRVPFLADLKPSGKYVMEDLHNAGGTPAVLKYLLEHRLIDGSCLTVTGKTLAENLAACPGLKAGQQVLMPLDRPIKPDGHLQILYGNLSPQGSVGKITGKEGLVFEGTALCFDCEEDMIEALAQDPEQFRASAGGGPLQRAAGRGARHGTAAPRGTVVVIRYEGPKGGPGMPEMLTPTSAIMGAGLGKECALITDGRFSGGSHGFVIGHVCPEAQEGGPIALVRNGDRIRIDAQARVMDVLGLSDEEWAARRAAFVPPPLKATSGTLYKYIKNVRPASEGCVTDAGVAIRNPERVALRERAGRRRQAMGDCVLIMAEGDPNNEAPYIGRILEIKEPAAPGDDHEIRVCWFYRPEEVLGGRKVFHGQLELYHSDHEDTVAAETIQCHCQVLDLEKFMELEAEEEGPTFFARFSYYPAKRAFKPDRVPVYCKCEMPFNPDVPMVCCR